MAELPAPPAPVGLAEIAEEPAAAAVPVGAELEPPPVVEDEVFFSRFIFWELFIFRFLASRVWNSFVVILRLASFVAWFSSYARYFWSCDLFGIYTFFRLFILLCSEIVLSLLFTFRFVS